MMISLALCLSILAAATATNTRKQPYEEDPDHFGEQNIMAMVNVTERLYVYRRNFNTTTKHRCLFAQRKAQINETLYTYTLGAELNRTFFEYDVNSTLSTTGNHSKYNAATYPNAQGAKPKLRKLMTKDPENKCFIFVEELENGKKGCQLMMTKSQAEEDEVPEKCQQVYHTECTGQSTKLYNAECKNDPTANQ